MAKLKLSALISCLILSVIALSGCFVAHTVEFLTPEGPPDDETVIENYLSINLRQSDAVEVLEKIHIPEYTVLSQSSSAVASSGQKKDGFKQWFSMVAFDEDKLTATRKYVFFVDEKPKFLFREPWTCVMFDCKMIIEPDILNEPYADSSARRVAFLRYAKEMLNNDIEKVRDESKEVSIMGMMINQAFYNVLIDLDGSPIQAVKLDDEKGLQFMHPSLEESRIGMTVEDDVMTIKLRMGSCAEEYKDLKDFTKEDSPENI